ncbi:MAG TPA: polysaccharide deacetylase family protein [Solirubrobacteraceae bacterium]|jgi:peptidoglycan/xylan/chitin deacetylase (PgdA/CDA1 family)
MLTLGQVEQVEHAPRARDPAGYHQMDIDSLHTRREASRLAVRRRRRRAAGLLAAVAAAAVAAVVLLSGSGGASGPRTSSVHTGGHSGHVAGGAGANAASRRGGGVRTGRPGGEPVPILMYHVIAAPPPGAPFPGLYVEPSQFAAQMRALKHAGWTAVTLDEVAAYWREGISLPAGKPIVVSFDNGYHSQFTQALPVLERLGWVGDENIQLTGLPPSQGGLSEGEVRALIAAGWELDTQGTSHADLIKLDALQLHEQVAGTRAILRRRYHVPLNWFCYPSGHYDATVVAAVAAAGYAGSTTVVPGWAHRSDDPYRLHRLRVLGGTSPAALLSLIAATQGDPPAPASYNGT